MISSYFKIALRAFAANKLYAFINVFALSVAMACGIVAYVNYDFSRSFDRFHANLDEIYALRSTSDEQRGNINIGITPRPLGPALKRDYPQIKDMTRVVFSMSPLKFGEKVFNQGAYFVDDGFLRMFTFPVVEGDGSSFKDMRTIFLTEETARRYFGDESPLGKTLELNLGTEGPLSFIVGAVLREIPSQSSIQFHVLLPLAALPNAQKDAENWNAWSNETFIRVGSVEDVEMISQRLGTYVDRHNAVLPDYRLSRIYVEPMALVASTSRDLTNDILKEGMHPAAVFAPTVTAILLLMTACINFMNTSLAFSALRLKEVGIRKVLGGVRRQLIVQFVGENLLLCTVALLAAMALAEIFVPAYSDLWPDWDLTLDYANDWGLFVFLGALLASMSILSGAYPALYVSRFSPSAILTGRQRLRGNSRLMRGILVFQFALSTLTVLTGIVFTDNARFFETFDLGFETKESIAIPLQNAGIYESMRHAAEQHPGITGVSGTRHLIGYNQGTQTVKYASMESRAAVLNGEYNYRETAGLKLVKGRDFGKNLKTDRDQSIIVSEKLAKELRLEEPVGAKIVVDSARFTIIGVVQDFYNRSVWRPLQPSALRMVDESQFRYLVVRATRSNLQEVNEYLREQWGSLVPNIPYEGFYQDELLANPMAISSNIRLVFLYVSGVAIAIAAMGLFALSSLIIVRRTKEIGIRKVLGASVPHLVRLLNHQIAGVLLLSSFIAAIGGFFMINAFLDSLYAYHIQLQIWHFVLAGAIIMLVGFLTVSSQVLKVATANPVEALRYE